MRFWSPEQKYLLEVLKKTGCMRKSQALTLLHRQFGTSPNDRPHLPPASGCGLSAGI